MLSPGPAVLGAVRHDVTRLNVLSRSQDVSSVQLKGQSASWLQQNYSRDEEPMGAKYCNTRARISSEVI